MLPADHPEASAKRVSLARLKDLAWAGCQPGTGHHAMHVRACRQIGGFEPDLRLQGATEGLAELEPGSFDLGFIDGPKSGYGTHLDQIVYLLRPGGLLLVDNVLMGGGAATGQPINQWGAESIAVIRAFNADLKRREDLRTTFLAVGDGVAIGVRQ